MLVGWAVLPSIAVMCIISPLNFWCSNKFEKVVEDVMKRQDERVKLIGELLQGMLVVKLFAWEDHLKQKVCRTRSPDCLPPV